MGIYNPHAPVVLGNELVGLADAMRDIDINTEWGYSFTVTGAPNTNLVGAVSVHGRPDAPVNGKVLFTSIYPRGREDDVGDVRFIDLPLTFFGVTGASASVSNPTTYAWDNEFIRFDAANDVAWFGGGHDAVLLGKRILGIDVLYAAAGTPGFALEFGIANATTFYGYGPLITGPATVAQLTGINSFSIGEVNPFWNNTSNPSNERMRMPWRYTELSDRWTGGFGSRPLFWAVRVSELPLSGIIDLSYLAFRIHFCDENRVLYGGVALGDDPAGVLSYADAVGLTATNLRNTSFQITGSLSAGDYTATICQADAGDKYNAGGTIGMPQFTQFRDGVETHPAVKINRFKKAAGTLPPFPPETEETDLMTAIALRCVTGSSAGTELQSGNAPVTYTSLWGTPVYVSPAGTSVTAVQPIHNVAGTGDTSYEYVRFYARRNNPTAPGDLTVSVAGSGSATITPEEFDALPQLTQDGWREITLPITAVFTNDLTFRNVTFTMTGVATGNRVDQWQVGTLLVSNPETETNPGSGFTDGGGDGCTPYRQARYDGWLTDTADIVMPYTVGDANDITAAATLSVMFSQESIAVTGFSVTGAGCAIELETFDTCDLPAGCIPTAILGNSMSWNIGSVADTFDDDVAAGSWGTADTGQPWAVSGGTTSTDYYVSGGVGIHSLSAVNVGHRSSIDGPILNPDVTVKVIPSVLATGSTLHGSIMARFVDSSNFYFGEAQFETTGLITARIRKSDGGTFTTFTSVSTGLSYTAGTEIMLRFRIVGSMLQLKVWRGDFSEPLTWTTTVVDTTFAAAGAVGVRSATGAANTNPLPVIMSFDDFMSIPTEMHDGYVEIQRMDEIDDEWQTVLLSNNLARNSFCDFEARVGETSWYRIRTLTDLEFVGPWATGSAFLPSPAVSGVGDGNSVLIFTSNQDTAASLAYVMQFEGDPEEEFNFPEAGFQQLRTQYQRDFFTAFRPTERGGESFTREILVHNAAIPAPSLANFKSLRDLAWAALPYVCVRDELGNRWYANVLVPSGRVRSRRTVYIAQIQIVEVTDTPAPVED